MTISSEMLIALRKDRGWSQNKLSIITGISERTIQRVEQDGSTCSLETKLALASAFEISPTALSPGTPERVSADAFNENYGRLFFLLPGAITLILYFFAAAGFDPRFDVVSGILYVGSTLALALLMSVMINSAKSTRFLIEHFPEIIATAGTGGLNKVISHTQTLIWNLYISGIVLTILASISGIFMGTIGPFLMAALIIAEFWARPYKRKAEKMLIERAGNIQPETTTVN